MNLVKYYFLKDIRVICASSLISLTLSTFFPWHHKLDLLRGESFIFNTTAKPSRFGV